MFILRLKSKNTFFFMKYLRMNYDHIFIKKFNWKFWYQKLRKKILDLWNRSRESVYIYVSISKSQSIIDLENRRITSLILTHRITLHSISEKRGKKKIYPIYIALHLNLNRKQNTIIDYIYHLYSNIALNIFDFFRLMII